MQPDHTESFSVGRCCWATRLALASQPVTTHPRDRCLRAEEPRLPLRLSRLFPLAHVPAKWGPVRRQEHAPLKNFRACPHSEGMGHALVAMAPALSILHARHRAHLA